MRSNKRHKAIAKTASMNADAPLLVGLVFILLTTIAFTILQFNH